jgi:hypothetical protein
MFLIFLILSSGQITADIVNIVKFHSKKNNEQVRIPTGDSRTVQGAVFEHSIRSSIVDLLKLVGLGHSVTDASLVLMTLGIISPLTRERKRQNTSMLSLFTIYCGKVVEMSAPPMLLSLCSQQRQTLPLL